MDKSADQDTKEKMAPYNCEDPVGEPSGVGEEELREMELVNQSLDQINNVLDLFEQRTDNIIEQLKELLHSNRQIREEIAKEQGAGHDSNLD